MPPTLGIPLTNISETYLINFSGPFSKCHLGNKFLLIVVEHLTGWPIAPVTKNASTEVVIEFVEREIISLFRPPNAIISDNAGCFTATSLFLPTPICLTAAPRKMIRTIKAGIRKMFIRQNTDWQHCLPSVLYGYRIRPLAMGTPPFDIMPGVRRRMNSSNAVSLVTNVSDVHPRLELLAVLGLRATRVDPQLQRGGDGDESRTAKFFNVVDFVLVAHGHALNSVRWPALRSRLFGPCRIWKAAHARYWLTSYGGRSSSGAIQARSLAPFARLSYKNKFPGRPVDISS